LVGGVVYIHVCGIQILNFYKDFANIMNAIALKEHLKLEGSITKDFSHKAN
jgi:hypothetical protein